MRLYDRLLCSDNEHTKRLRDASSKTSVLCCDEIAKYYADSKDDNWGSDRYPYSMPPWDCFFVEWTQPPTWSVDGLSVKNECPYQQEGLFGYVIRDEKLIRATIEHSRKLTSDGDFAKISAAEVIVYAQPFMSMDGVGHTAALHAIWFLRKDGWVCANTVTMTQDVLDSYGGAVDQSSFNQASIWIGQLNHIAMTAFTFANCANVKLKDSTDDIAPIAKIRRRLKLPEVKRYTLDICGHSSQRSRGSCGQDGIMPFHLCRGHFATYTADKPLFGRPGAVGRFWHPPHTKGKKERGEVIKDYAVKEPANA